MERDFANILDKSDEEMDRLFKQALAIANEIKQIKGVPIAKYDLERREPYLEYPDGSREYAKET